jgi:hypothetical protein
MGVAVAALLIWLSAAVPYAAFSLWYNALRGPLMTAEVDAFVERLRTQSAAPVERLAPVRAFLNADDGREFFMMNLIRLHDGFVTEPESDQVGYFLPWRCSSNQAMASFWAWSRASL